MGRIHCSNCNTSIISFSDHSNPWKDRGFRVRDVNKLYTGWINNRSFFIVTNRAHEQRNRHIQKRAPLEERWTHAGTLNPSSEINPPQQSCTDTQDTLAALMEWLPRQGTKHCRQKQKVNTRYTQNPDTCHK